MKILIVNYKYDYDRAWNISPRGLGAYYYLWHLPLLALAKEKGHTVEAFWVDEEIKAKGRCGMNQALRDMVYAAKPDVALFLGGELDFDRAVLQKLKERSGTVTVYFGGDEAWRFDSLSRYSAPHFVWVVTLQLGAEEKYRAIGCTKVVKSQVGVNTDIYHPVPVPRRDIDVSFVGTYNKARGAIVRTLLAAGIKVFVRGNGWPEGSLSQEEMIRSFSRSKIVLSLNPPEFFFGWKPLVRLFFRRAYLGEGGSSVKLDVHHFFSSLRQWLQKRATTLRGRNFEVLACHTLLMTQSAENIEDYYVPDKEIILYADTPDLINKIKYYLAHEAEREAIAAAAYERTIREHTSQKRLLDIFAEIGCPL